MNKITVIIIIAAISLATVSLAELSSANYKIPALVLTSGGATELSSTNYKLTDTKGFYGGVLTDGLILQLGGVFVIVPWAPPGGTLSGRITDAVTGDPIAGANITVVGAGIAAISGAGGDYSMFNVPPGTYTIRCASPDYLDSSVPDVTVRNRETTTVNFRLVRGAGGPALTLTALLQGFYSAGNQVQTNILVEARTVPAGADDIPANATIVAGSTTITLNADRNTTGTNGFGALAEGDYYLVIKHIKGGNSIHLPIITAAKKHIPGIYNFSTADLSYTPAGGRLSDGRPFQRAVFEKDGRFLLWAGDLNGDKQINSGDYTIWLEKRDRDPASPIADLNGSGGADAVDSSDYTIWLESRNLIGSQADDQSYVPAAP